MKHSHWWFVTKEFLAKGYFSWILIARLDSHVQNINLVMPNKAYLTKKFLKQKPTLWLWIDSSSLSKRNPLISSKCDTLEEDVATTWWAVRKMLLTQAKVILDRGLFLEKGTLNDRTVILREVNLLE